MDFNKYDTPNLDEKSISLRSLVLQALVGGGRGHIGSSLSLIEIIRVIYDDCIWYLYSYRSPLSNDTKISTNISDMI